MDQAKPVGRIDVISDAICPWCYIGKRHLERALDAHDPALLHLAVAPTWDSLRADPRFNECLARMKLRPVS